MKRQDFINKCDEVQKYWGNKMPMMLMEESGELIQAISKYERDKNANTRQNLIDEIGDMYISLMAIQLQYETDISPEEVEKRIEKKLNKKY